ncbi:hypothetical protein TorRG33x02_341760 [Trema orientale]|uniref:Uncharacterized protein n=1 Tax=Trema orientale TaxID=63057 RepID=A0A2P5ATF1_TREOI|nr:hypothetical protein TorRG33x02_341760 [Trema orientale]
MVGGPSTHLMFVVISSSTSQPKIQLLSPSSILTQQYFLSSLFAVLMRRSRHPRQDTKISK